MLHLQKISLIHFRNYLQQTFYFKDKVMGICGNNGSGKTNILDAIYTLCMARSYFATTDVQNVTRGQQGLRLDGFFNLINEIDKVAFVIRENNKKEILLNDIGYKKFSEHIGRFPCVMIAPDDTEILTGGSETRRKFIDNIIAQINSLYLHWLIDYNKIIQQRNSLLKQIAETGQKDATLLNILNEQLSQKAQLIYSTRKEFLIDFFKAVLHYYKIIADDLDAISLNYESSLHTSSMQQLLEQNLHRDLALQRTASGIHKDDIAMQMNDMTFKTTASQGQRKSLLFALKLAEWQLLKTNKGFAPILLLDDVFEKLDEQRMNNLLHWVCTEDDGQVLITDTHKERLEKTLSKANISFGLIELI